jgi:hypothetical protein
MRARSILPARLARSPRARLLALPLLLVFPESAGSLKFGPTRAAAAAAAAGAAKGDA